MRGYSDRASVRGWDVGGLPRTGAKRAQEDLVPEVSLKPPKMGLAPFRLPELACFRHQFPCFAFQCCREVLQIGHRIRFRKCIGERTCLGSLKT